MTSKIRNFVLAAISVSALAGCNTTAPINDCDRTSANQPHNSKCCSVGDNCKEGRGGRESRGRQAA